MKRALIICVFFLITISCDYIFKEEDYSSNTIEGEWILKSCKVVVDNADFNVKIDKYDTICIGGCNSSERFFIVGQTIWKISGYELYCNHSGSDSAGVYDETSIFVSLSRSGTYLTDNSAFEVYNSQTGIVTNFTIDMSPKRQYFADELTLMSPDFYYSYSSYSYNPYGLINLRVLLKFQRI